ncbi:MAG: CopG family transcriptional regulator [Acidimicrobiia bacterium]|nr:CopG family transcriptional regulator [Acidimicrobiia bacterium]
MPEKITINMEPVDLGKIDLLVEQGLYANRTDLIRTAIRNQIDKHATTIQDVIVRKSWVLGVEVLSRSDLEKWIAKGERQSARIIGMLSLGSDVTPELALQAFESIDVRGAFRAPQRVKEALLQREDARLQAEDARMQAEDARIRMEDELISEETRDLDAGKDSDGHEA